MYGSRNDCSQSELQKGDQQTDPAPDTRSVTSFPRCSYDWPKSLPTFLRNHHISSSQSFQRPREPNSATLKKEATRSSETLK